MDPKTRWLRELGQRISAAREKAGISQGDLAAAVAVHRQTVYRWEAGGQPPDSYSLARVAAALHVRVGRLLPEIW